MVTNKTESWVIVAILKLRSLKNWWIQRFQQAPLRLALVVPFAIQICLAVSLAGYFSFLSGQQAVGELANQLLEDVGDRVVLRLDSYLQAPHLLNRLNASAVRSGELDPNDLTAFHRHLILQHQQFPTITTLSFATPQGDSRTIYRVDPQQDEERYRHSPIQASVSEAANPNEMKVYGTDSQGNLTQLIREIPNFDIRDRPWYRDAVKTKKPGWSEVYQIGQTRSLGISAYQPIYAPDSDRLLGVLSANFSLSEISQFLSTLKVGESGAVFVLERNGAQIANSLQEPPYSTSQTSQNTVKFTRLSAEASRSPLIKAASRYLRQQSENRDGSTDSRADLRTNQHLRFAIEGREQFLLVLPYRDQFGLDWLIGVVAPESDFLGRIQVNTNLTILICFLAAMGAIAMGVYTSRWITHPILRLSHASQRVAEGEFNATLPAKGMKELNVMARSFNRMMQEIRQSRRQLQEYSAALEQEVSQRTQELQQEIAERVAAQQALQRANHELEKLAYLDGLTQVSNRRQFDKILEQEWNRLAREQAPLSLILCDADFFKSYNDRYGHQAGDDCLRQIARAIGTAAKRPGDLVARYGGEEFVAVLPLTTAEGATKVAEEIRTAIHQLQLVHESSTVNQVVTVSLGIATVVPEANQSPADLIAAADRALYEAKAAGRDRMIAVTIDRLSDRANHSLPT
jgi:diguanylate cyclase (GGDEF)-like protein